jgi:hypothetical protein
MNRFVIALASATALAAVALPAQAMNCRPSLGGYDCEPGLNEPSNGGFHTSPGLGGSFNVEPNNFDLNPYRYANPFRNQWNRGSNGD